MQFSTFHLYSKPPWNSEGDVVRQELEQARPRYVVWDHRGVVVWETDPANRPLSDYVWRCYEQVTAFNLYLVLERRSQAC